MAQQSLVTSPCAQKQQLWCSATAAQPSFLRQPRCRSRHVCRAASSGDGSAGKLPVVDDAISLPPPATGSQYAWRRSWGGSSQSSATGGGGGGSGKTWQARTRDWGRGPNGSVLFALLYRMRLLLLYGVWVTVLYGAFRALVDVTTAAGRAGYALINTAAAVLHRRSSSESSSRASDVPAVAGTVAAEQEPLLQEVSSCADETYQAAGGAPVAHGPGSSSTTSSSSGHAGIDDQQHSSSSPSAGSTSGFPGAAGRLRDRTTVPVFENLMSAVIPLYLMLLGSVVFFASM